VTLSTISPKEAQPFRTTTPAIVTHHIYVALPAGSLPSTTSIVPPHTAITPIHPHTFALALHELDDTGRLHTPIDIVEWVC
jgi:hypothetical protein